MLIGKTFHTLFEVIFAIFFLMTIFQHTFFRIALKILKNTLQNWCNKQVSKAGKLTEILWKKQQQMMMIIQCQHENDLERLLTVAVIIY